MHPFQPAVLHPLRRAFLGSGYEIKCCANAELDRPDLGLLLPDKILLLRGAQADEHESSSRAIDAMSDCILLLGTKRRKWWGLCTNNLQAWKTGKEIGLELPKCLGCRAVEIDADLVLAALSQRRSSSCGTADGVPKANLVKWLRHQRTGWPSGQTKSKELSLERKTRIMRCLDKHRDRREIDSRRAVAFRGLGSKHR